MNYFYPEDMEDPYEGEPFPDDLPSCFNCENVSSTADFNRTPRPHAGLQIFYTSPNSDIGAILKKIEERHVMMDIDGRLYDTEMN